MKSYSNPVDVMLTRSLCARAFHHRSDLHGDGLQGVVPAFPRMPNHLSVLEADGSVRCIHARGVGHVAGFVPESSQEILGTVLFPRVLVFVKGGELGGVLIRQTVSWMKEAEENKVRSRLTFVFLNKAGYF